MNEKKDDRTVIQERLFRDIIGPYSEDEEIDTWPSDTYLTGILWPMKTRMTEEDDDRISIAGESVSDGDQSSSIPEEEEVTSLNMNRPSTAGISFAVQSEKKPPVINVSITYGRYLSVTDKEKKSARRKEPDTFQSKFPWKRTPFRIEKKGIIIGDNSAGLIDLTNDTDDPGIRLHMRTAPWSEKKLVTLTLINQLNPDRNQGREGFEKMILFQVRMEVTPGKDTYLVARPPGRILKDDASDDEDKSADLLYRNSYEFAVGHTCSAEWDEPPDPRHPDRTCRVATTWIPYKLVSAVSASGHEVFHPLIQKGDAGPLSATWLSEAPDKDLCEALLEVTDAYEKWIRLQEEKISTLPDCFVKPARKNVDTCRTILERMREGANLIGTDPLVAGAFRLANKAMVVQYNWTQKENQKKNLIWRPFQIGFILLAISSVADRTHKDRSIMDLLWFPTGGGKTEAYLTLVAFLGFYRRLKQKQDPDDGAGVAAVMRYTLRLLTTQQFIRASSMILACEAIRRGKIPGIKPAPDLGKKPFSIGLWVGSAATPNSYMDACQALTDSSSEIPSPKQLTKCPCCDRPLTWYPDSKKEMIRVRCDNDKCLLYDMNDSLPVLTVDEDVYRERPTLLIGTIDKFAQITRNEKTNSLFSVNKGLPPDLIIQDELHLISGPLGTLAGLYETALDRILTHDGMPPKIIGSTATIRRAPDQIRALFNRSTCQFPYPAIDADDSGFAVRDPDAPGRLYLGVTTAGRSGTFTLQAVAASLLQSGYGGFPTDERRDPYWTLVAYFNSLRELGGALVLIQDDVNASIPLLASRRNEERRRLVSGNIEELTSRRTQDDIREMLDKINRKAGQPGALDVVLATNMMSVGVDIPRLGLMLVNGQPKGISEYIQATSRVGRGRVPGIIITILNNGKARDRSHYESFVSIHANLYRDVEATSVTPFSSRARDRALHAVLVTLVRHTIPGMLEQPRLDSKNCDKIEKLIGYIRTRAQQIDPEERGVETELRELLRIWEVRHPVYYWNDASPRESLLIDADRAATLREIGTYPVNAWPTMNNMRSVEPSTKFELIPRVRKHDPRRGNHAQ